jgi:hypothetical protein
VVCRKPMRFTRRNLVLLHLKQSFSNSTTIPLPAPLSTVRLTYHSNARETVLVNRAKTVFTPFKLAGMLTDWGSPLGYEPNRPPAPNPKLQEIARWQQ